MSDENKPTLSAELSEAINKHLPGMLSGELRMYLRRADEALVQIKELYQGNASLAKENERLRSENAQLVERDKRMTEREAKCAERERAISLRESDARFLELQRTCAEEKLALAVELFKIPFGNRILREHLLINETGQAPAGVAPPSPYNSSPTTMTGYTSNTREEKHESEEL
jgi:hypothetical protein